MLLSVVALFFSYALAAFPDTAQCSENHDHAVLLQVSTDIAKTRDLSTVRMAQAATPRSEEPHNNEGQTQHALYTKNGPAHRDDPYELNLQLDMNGNIGVMPHPRSPSTENGSAAGLNALKPETLTPSNGKTRRSDETGVIVCISVIVAVTVVWLVCRHMPTAGPQQAISTPADISEPESPQNQLADQQIVDSPRRDPDNPVEDGDSTDSMGFERRNVKASVLDTYAITSALLTGFGVCTTAIEHHIITKIGVDDPIRSWMLLLYQILIRLSTALALFSMLVFSLSTLYAKTALSSRKHACELYDWFIQQSFPARQLGFWFMYWSSILYMCAIGMGCFYSLRDTLAALVSLTVFALAAMLLWYTKGMIDAAFLLYESEETQKAVLLRTKC